MLVLQWLLYLASTIGSYYKWWVESNQGPGVYTFASTPIEDLEGPIKELQQECTWMDHKMSTESFAPSSPLANVSGSPSPESASGELIDGPEANIGVGGAALVRLPQPPHPLGPTPPHPTSTAPAAAATPAPAPAPQHQHPSTKHATNSLYPGLARRPCPLPNTHHRTPRGTPRGTAQ